MMISFNFGIFRVVLIPILMDAAKPAFGEAYATKVGSIPLVVGIIGASLFVYLNRDQRHRKIYLWFPYLNIIIYFTAPLVLMVLIFCEEIYVNLIMASAGVFLSTLSQAKLTIDRNVMSTDEYLPSS